MFGFGKGKINVILEKSAYMPGDMIKGKLVLALKKPVSARKLKVSLKGVQKATSVQVSKNRVGSSTQTSEVYNFETVLEGEREYTGGEYTFEFKVPTDILQQVGKLEGGVGQVVSAMKALSGRRERVSWFVVGSLDVPRGIDVNGKAQITIG